MPTNARFATLVSPGIPIHPAAVAIHGITDAMAAAAPAFRDVASDLKAFADRSIVIGHTIHYDLAVLEREYGLAARRWPGFRALDVRMLARLAAPSLAEHSLGHLCEWLGTELKGRHTAVGDAEAAGNIFLALVPLREDLYFARLGSWPADVRTAAALGARGTQRIVRLRWRPGCSRRTGSRADGGGRMRP